MPAPTIVPLGEDAWLLQFPETGGSAFEAVTAAASAIREARLPGVIELVPSYTTLAVRFDPAEAGAEHLETRIRQAAVEPRSAVATAPPPLIEIPVRYDGPDLPEVAERTGLTVSEVIQRHSEHEYRVYALGFVPGFAYLGDLDPALVLPRRESPRTRVPAGSVAIAAQQTGIYPFETPGGWHLIGSTSAVMFDPTRSPPPLLLPGYRVRFVPSA